LARKISDFLCAGSASKGPGIAGNYTEEEGFLAYYEICDLIAQGGWTQKTDSDGNPYIVKVNFRLFFSTFSY
jgi:hypothetical protein